MPGIKPLLVVLAVSCSLYGCAANAPVDTAGSGAQAQNGTELYTRYCASCHGRLTVTAKPGRRAARITSAIQNNIGGMGYLSSLEDLEIQAIADELALVVPPRDAGGDDLYRMYCASCHGPLDKSDIAGSSIDDIMGAASRQVCSAGNMKYLGKEEISRILQSLNRKAGE